MQEYLENQMILQRLRGGREPGTNVNANGSTKRAQSPSTPTSFLDEDSATPTTSNSSSAASTCDVVLTRSGQAALKQQQQQQPKEAANAANVNANATAAAASTNPNSAEAVRPPVLCHRKSVAISYRGRGISQAHPPPVIADACPNTPSEEALAVVTLAMFFGGAALIPVVFLAGLFAAVFFRQAWGALVIALLAAATAAPAGGISQRFRHARVWDCWRRYFNLRAAVPEIPYVDPNRRYIVVQTPHSVFPMGTFLNAGITDVPVGGMPVDVVAVVADVLLSLPLYKHIFAMIGCHPADGKTLAKLLKNNSVAINPEGVAGIFHGSSRSDRSDPELAKTERVYLANRKGFVRHAIRAGAPLLPVHHIGASQLLGFTGYPALSRRLRATVGCWWGRRGLPMPHKQEILTVVGDPIDVVQCDAPTQEQVDEVHAKLCRALCDMFEGHKGKLGPEWAEKKMVIV